MTNSHVTVTGSYAVTCLLSQLSLLENAFRLRTSLLLAIAGFRVFYKALHALVTLSPYVTIGRERN